MLNHQIDTLGDYNYNELAKYNESINKSYKKKL